VGLAAGNLAAKFEPTGIASRILDAYGKHREKQELRNEFQEMMRAGFSEFRAELAQAMAEIRPSLPPETEGRTEAYLMMLRTSAQQTTRALGDAATLTVPDLVSLDEPDQLAAFLPQRAPRFSVGDSVPGLPSWKLLEPLGAGGFGEVWRAENPYSGVAAFKFFLDPLARERFTSTEAAALAEIHKNAPPSGVVRFYEAEPGQDPPWLQLEYIEGGDLSRLLEAWKALPDAERVKRIHGAIRGLATTVGHFHTIGVVHRDLKPSNILLRKTANNKYQPVIADFGISKIVPAAIAKGPTPTNATTSTIQAHTILYASPQQKKFRPADRRDDVYALGVLWYQLLRGDLTLERPSGDGWKQTLARLGVNDATVALLNRCWDDEPDVRPADGNELVELLAQCTEVLPLPPEVLPPPAPRSSAKTKPVVVQYTAAVVPPTEPPRQDRKQRERAAAEDDNLPLTSTQPDGEMSLRSKLLFLVIAAPCLLATLLAVGLLLTGGGKKEQPKDGQVSRSVEESPAKRTTTTPTPPPPQRDPVPPSKSSKPVTPVSPETPIIPKTAVKGEPSNPVADFALTEALRAIPLADAAVEEAANKELDRIVTDSKAADPAVRRKAVDDLSMFLANRSVQIRRKAVQALAGMGVDAEPATAALQEATKDTDIEVRKQARKALDGISETLAAMKTAKAHEAVLAIAKDLKSKDAPKRLKALQQIAEYGPDANIVGEQIIEAMVDKVPAIQTAAADTLLKVNPKVQPHVVTVLFGMEKHAAVEALEKLGTEAAITIPLLIALLQNTTAAGDSAYVIQNVRRHDMFMTLTKIAPKDKRVAAVVLSSIAARLPPTSPPFGTGALKRRAALEQLSVIDAEAAEKVKACLAALVDGVQAPRVIASLEGMGKEAATALPTLKKLTTAPNDAVRKAAVKAISAIE
jgi:serine/threonine protein kinase